MIAAADHVEAALDRGADPADMDDQMNLLDAYFGNFMEARRSSGRAYTKVLRDFAEAMEAAARRDS